MMMRMDGGAILGLQIRMFCPHAYICSNFPTGDGQSKGRGQRNGKNPGWLISFHESVSVASSSISHSQASHRLRQISDQLEATKSTKPAQVRKENDPNLFPIFRIFQKQIFVQFFQLQIGQIFKHCISPYLLASYYINFSGKRVMNCSFVFSLSPISSCNISLCCYN